MYIYNSRLFDAVYSRFSVHAIDEDQENILFNNVFKCLKEDGIFAIEVRGIHDELYKKGRCVGRNAYIYEDHYRRFIEINELISKLIKVGFIVQYAEENRDFAPFKESNPRVIRVVVKKSSVNYKDYFNHLIEKYNKLIILGCALSISSRMMTDVGLSLIRLKAYLLSSYPMYPGEEPINLFTEALSEYSDISKRTRFFSSL